MPHRLAFFDDPGPFLELTGSHLGADPVVNTILATTAERDRAERQRGIPAQRDDWYLAVLDDQDRVVGVGMRTARFPPRPLYLLPMPDPAAVLLAHALVDRSEPVAAANGALPGTAIFAEESARLSGGTVEVEVRTRLFELRRVIDPRPVPGALRLATHRDAELVVSWFEAFRRDADEQGGRPAGPAPSSASTALEPEAVLRRIEAGLIWLWTDPAGRPVHLTGANAPSFGAQRIGPVYTPGEHRGRGYASATVAALSRRFLAAGARPCLSTDQANPVSNGIYRAIGFEPVVDMINLRIVGPEDGAVRV